MKDLAYENISKAVEGLNLILKSISSHNGKIDNIHKLMYLMALDISTDLLCEAGEYIADEKGSDN